MFYDNDLLIGRVLKKVKRKNKKNMEIHNMTLYDALQEATMEFAKIRTELLLPTSRIVIDLLTCIVLKLLNFLHKT